MKGEMLNVGQEHIRFYCRLKGVTHGFGGKPGTVSATLCAPKPKVVLTGCPLRASLPCPSRGLPPPRLETHPSASASFRHRPLRVNRQLRMEQRRCRRRSGQAKGESVWANISPWMHQGRGNGGEFVSWKLKLYVGILNVAFADVFADPGLCSRARQTAICTTTWRSRLPGMLRLICSGCQVS